MPLALVGADKEEILQRGRHLQGSDNIVRRPDQARTARRGQMPAMHAHVIAGIGENHLPGADIVARKVAVLDAVVRVVEDEVLVFGDQSLLRAHPAATFDVVRERAA